MRAKYPTSSRFVTGSSSTPSRAGKRTLSRFVSLSSWPATRHVPSPFIAARASSSGWVTVQPAGTSPPGPPPVGAFERLDDAAFVAGGASSAFGAFVALGPFGAVAAFFEFGVAIVEEDRPWGVPDATGS